MNELEQVILEPGSENVVRFTPRTSEYGCAEFSICSVIRRGKLQTVFLYPRQQPNAEHYYEVPMYGSDPSLMISSHAPGRSEPRVWRTWWCKDHGCMSFDVYPPPDTTGFYVGTGTFPAVTFVP